MNTQVVYGKKNSWKRCSDTGQWESEGNEKKIVLARRWYLFGEFNINFNFNTDFHRFCQLPATVTALVDMARAPR